MWIEIAPNMFTILKCFVGNEERADGEIRLHLTTYSLIGGTYAVDAGDMSSLLLKSAKHLFKLHLLQFPARTDLNDFENFTFVPAYVAIFTLHNCVRPVMF